MKKIYRKTERGFEKLTTVAIAILSNSVAFIVALCIVLFWLTNKRFLTLNIHSSIGDVIMGLTFLCLFIIQKSFNRFSASLHLKINELLASHEPANNLLIGAEEKTDMEIIELSRVYTELALATEENETLKSEPGL